MSSLIVIGLAVCMVLGTSAVAFAREKTIWALVQLIGASLLVVVVLAHVAEVFRLLPSMGWGLPDSAGHYVDLVSALLGLVLFPVGYVARWRARRRLRFAQSSSLPGSRE
jgi:hypothetical protein